MIFKRPVKKSFAAGGRERSPEGPPHQRGHRGGTEKPKLANRGCVARRRTATALFFKNCWHAPAQARIRLSNGQFDSPSLVTFSVNSSVVSESLWFSRTLFHRSLKPACREVHLWRCDPFPLVETGRGDLRRAVPVPGFRRSQISRAKASLRDLLWLRLCIPGIPRPSPNLLRLTGSSERREGDRYGGGLEEQRKHPPARPRIRTLGARLGPAPPFLDTATPDLARVAPAY